MWAHYVGKETEVQRGLKLAEATALVKAKDWTRTQAFCFPDQSSRLSCPGVDSPELLCWARLS